MALQLLGIPANDPKARIARQFLFAQGGSGGQIKARDIVLVGQGLSGTDPIEATPQNPILNQTDCFARVGRKSELAWGWRALQMTAPQATVYMVQVAPGGGAAAATIVYTFATTATQQGTCSFWALGVNIQFTINVGDTATVQGASFAAAINGNPDVPFTASNSSGAVTLTMLWLGPRGTLVLANSRCILLSATGSTVSKGSVTAGTTADSFANAIAALAPKNIYYHVPAALCATNFYYTTTAVTATDASVGQYIAAIESWSNPATGYDNVVLFGVDATQANATTAATASAANAVLAKFFRTYQNDWTPFMVAAHIAGAIWTQENTYAGASFTLYATNSTIGTVLSVPPPYNGANAPSLTTGEVSADLNNGVTPVLFDPQGGAYFNRMITNYSYVPGTSTNDYDAREGHIPSVIHYAWEYLFARWSRQRQPNVMNDLPQGKRPLPRFNTPGGLQALINNVIDVLSSPSCPSNNTPILDPSPDAIKRMKASVFVAQVANGLQASVSWEPVRHDNQDDFLVLQGGDDT